MSFDKVLQAVSKVKELDERAVELQGLADSIRRVRNDGNVLLKLKTGCKVTAERLKVIEKIAQSSFDRLNIGYEVLFQVEHSLRRLAREARMKSALLKERINVTEGYSDDF